MITNRVCDRRYKDAEPNTGKPIVTEMVVRYNKILRGQRYRHFKGNIYVVDTVACDTDNNEFRIIYHLASAPDMIFDRPLAEFMSLVDFYKYPEAGQIRRFELIPHDDIEVHVVNETESEGTLGEGSEGN